MDTAGTGQGFEATGAAVGLPVALAITRAMSETFTSPDCHSLQLSGSRLGESILAADWSTIVTIFGSWVIVTALVIVVVGRVTGAVLGGKSPETRATTTVVSGCDSHRSA